MIEEFSTITRKPRWAALAIALIYAALGVVYIVASDYIIARSDWDVKTQVTYQTLKGVLFILFTGAGLFIILSAYLNRVNVLVRQRLESEYALQSALERYPGPTAVFDEQRRIEFINLYTTQLLQMRKENILGQRSDNTFTAEKVPAFLAYLEEAFATGQPRGGEISTTTARGQRFFVCTFVPIRKDDKGIQRVIALAYDITDRKHSAIRMDQQRRELRQIIDLLPSFVFAKDDTGHYIMANQSFSEFHGYTPAEVIGRTSAEILHDAASVKEITRQDQEVMERGVTVFRACQAMADHKGQEHFFQVTKIPFRTASDNQAAVLGIALDITERLQHERALNKSEERFRALVDHSLDALFVYNDAGILTLVNDRACALLGRTRYDLIGQNFMDVLGRQENHGGRNLPIFYAGTSFQMQLPSLGQDDVPVEIRIGPLPGDEEGTFLAEVRDIRERINLERERQILTSLGVDLSASRDSKGIALNLFQAVRSTFPLDAFFFAERIGGRSRYRNKLVVDRVNDELQYFPDFDYEVRPDTPLRELYEGQSKLVLREEEATTDSRAFTPIGSKSRLSRSLMFVPITMGGRVMAIMSAQTYTANAYTQEMLAALQRMADLAGPALESARANRQKSLFAELGRQLGAAGTAEDVAEVAATLGDELVSWDSCIIGLYSRAEDNITYIYLADEVNGRRERIYEPNPIRRPRLLAERVLKEGPFLVLRERRKPGDTYVAIGRTNMPSLSMIWVPIPGENGPIGFISFQSYAYNAYDDDDLESARALADHCGAALNRTAFQEMLRYREERYRLAIDSTGAVAYQLDYIQNDYVFMGQQIEAITGYAADEISSALWHEITLEMNLDPSCEIHYDADGHKHFAQWRAEMRIRHRNGEERWLSDQAVQLQNSSGVPVGALGILRDITQQKQVELALRASEERYALSTRGANDGLWDWDLRNNSIHFSERWLQMLGIPADTIINSPEEWYSLIHSDDLHELRVFLKEHLEGTLPHLECELRMKHRNGTYRWMLIRGIAVRDAEGKPTRLAGSQTDITDRIMTQERLIHDALHDPLTSLPNRSMLMEQIARCLDQTRREASYRFALVFMDLDRFKMINDSLGHLVGDHVLVTVANRLKKAVRPLDTVARFAGDEFAVVLEHLEQESEIHDIVERIQAIVAEPISVDQHEIITTTSAGVALGSSEYVNPSDILRDADNALYKSKSEGPGRYCIFDASMHENAMQLLRMEADLRRAVDRSQLRLQFQPIINVATGAIERFEALLRWQHQELGILYPDQFINVAEETGLIFGLDEWVIAESCRWYKNWKESCTADECPDFRINVNLSPRHFLRHVNLAERLTEIVTREGVEPGVFGLELTENALLSFREETRTSLLELKAAGFSLYLDDFGKGYSSLSYLHNFPFDVVKIDRQFMMRIQHEVPEREIVNAILTLANKLDRTVVAEGVETAEQMDMVRELGCHAAQGYYISRPVEPQAAVNLLHEARTW